MPSRPIRVLVRCLPDPVVAVLAAGCSCNYQVLSICGRFGEITDWCLCARACKEQCKKSKKEGPGIEK